MTELGKADGFHELLRDGATYLEMQSIAYVYVCRKAQLFKISIFKYLFHFNLHVDMCLCAHVCEHCWRRARRGCQSPWGWNYRQS